MADTVHIGNGKGSKRRPGDEEAFRSGWDRTFSKDGSGSEKQDQAAPAAT